MRLDDKAIIAAIKKGEFVVCKDTGRVTTRRGRTIKPFPKKSGRLFVKLYLNRKVRFLPVAKLVWMSVTLRPVPKGFEVHHDDETNNHDSWDNLICLHELDHRKVHRQTAASSEEEIPF